MLDEAMKAERGEEVEEVTEAQDTVIDLAVDAFIPKTYITSEKLRIDIYKKIAEVRTEDDVYELTDELIDRFGEPPKAIMTLVNISQLRHTLSSLGVSKAVQNGDVVYIYTDVMHITPCEAMCLLWGSKLTFRSSAKPYFIMKTDRKSVISDLERFALEYAEIIKRYAEKNS